MTYFKTALICTVATFALASTSFAGEKGDYNKKNKDAQSKMKMDQKTDKKWNAETKANTYMTGATDSGNYVGDILQSNETNIERAENDDKLLLSNGKAIQEGTIDSAEGDMTVLDNAIIVPTTDGEFATTVACPIGTTAQADMTCLVTGDYNPK